MIYLKEHNTPEGKILAMCDSDLIGRVLKDEEIEIDLDKYRNFYIGKEMSEEEASDFVENSDLLTANVVGKESTSVFVKLGIAKKVDIRTVNGVPYLHIYKIKL
ncbi:MAG: DUF424 family protein [Candidatus Micrarchaeaceae archaeon]